MRDLRFQVLYNSLGFGSNNHKTLSPHRKEYTLSTLTNLNDPMIKAVRLNTGMVDGDNNPIYEGDILSYTVDGEDFGDIVVVEYSSVCGGYIVDVGGCDYDMTTIPWSSECHYHHYTVIGNIVEHPHLLQGVK